MGTSKICFKHFSNDVDPFIFNFNISSFRFNLSKDLQRFKQLLLLLYAALFCLSSIIYSNAILVDWEKQVFDPL